MGLYNRAVTGNFSKTPYTVHTRQYWQRGIYRVKISIDGVNFAEGKFEVF